MSGIEISKKLVLINSASSAVVLVLNLTILIWLQQYLLKRISPDEYALLPLVMALMAFTPLLSIVLTGGLGRYITVAYARGDNEEITRICSTMFPLLLAGGIVFLVIGWLAAWHIDKLLEIRPEFLTDASAMFALLVFSAAIRLPLAVFSSGFIVRQKLMLQDMIGVACQLFRIGLLFALLFGVGTSVLWITVALVASELLNVAISTPISMRLVPAQRIKWNMYNPALAREITGFGAWGFVDRVAETLKQAMDPLILNRFATSMDVSVFYVAGIVPRQLNLMLAPISRPFIPVLAALFATNDHDRLRNTYLRIARYHTWVLSIFVVPGVVFRDEIISLYLGGTYSSAADVMAVLLLVTSLSGLNALGPAIVAAAGEMKGFAQRMLLLQSTNLLLTAFFVMLLQLGARGAAFATLAASVIVEVLLVWPFCRKVAAVPMRLWISEVVVPGVAPAMVSAGFCLVVNFYLLIDSWRWLLALAAVSGAITLILIIIFGLREQDRLDIGRLATRLPPSLRTIILLIFKEILHK